MQNDSGKKVLEEFKGLTMYWARYSWATIADSLDIPEKTISKGLGHVDKTMAGRKYIAFDWSKVDKANRQIINHVLTDCNECTHYKNTCIYCDITSEYT